LFFLILMVSTRRPTIASRTLAEQLRPVVDIHRSIQDRGYATVDVELVRARIRSGRTGFDAAMLLEDAGDLTHAFAQTTCAMELAGLVSTPQVLAFGQLRVESNVFVVGWANAESTPIDPAMQFGRRVAGVVGNAILSRISREVMAGIPAVTRLPWRRPDCPCCAASPDLAFTTEARRYLVCWRCDATWRTEHRGCLSCGALIPPALVRIPSPYLGYELAICNACGRYLKERRGGFTHDPIVERALTAGLDDAARLRGLRT
jgi:Protein involved in formate dehydrogenase formation.